ncbi:serine hydrolase domain-containing protein [Saccharopolyspora sp. ID03-671]|uniref:serine hydrolase domain-containing protein n=1 Tax=Saccharopolyspora sp. ID03-671 TaxID=3073066 RepID=UPI003254D422
MVRTGWQRVGSVLAGAGMVLGLLSAPAQAEVEVDRGELQRALDELVASGTAGAQIRVHDARGDWVGTAGVRDLEHGGRVPANGSFRAGSITKTFVSTVVLQLVGEGRLMLDDPIAEHLPQFGLDPRITVRMLLQHTSGLFSYTGESFPDGHTEPGIPTGGPEFVAHRYRQYSPPELIEFALSKPPRFAPGGGWSYSNTNYQLLGMLIEKLTGTPWSFQVEHRILLPLGLRDTVLPGSATEVPDPHAQGYLAYPEAGELKTVDITSHNPSWGGAAGEIISTTADLDRFLGALFAGALLPSGLLAEMRAPHPDSGYGLGLESFDAGAECGGRYQGHSGGVAGYQSLLFSSADGSTHFSASMTTGALDPRDPGAIDRNIAARDKVVEIVACGTDLPDQRISTP